MHRFAAFVFLLGIATACDRGPVRPEAPAAVEGADVASRFELATPEPGAAVLSTRDEYLSALSPADLSIWLHRTDNGATASDLANLLASKARPWDEPGRVRLRAMLARVTPRLAPLARWLPHHILIASIAPEASDDADFTRGATIFFTHLQTTDAALDERFLHELFHVLSRANPQARDALYGVVGFVRCTPMALPADLRARVLTNPDAPHVDFAAPVSATEPDLLVTPLLVADPSRYDPAHTSFFDYYLHVRFTPLRRDPSGRCALAPDVTMTQAQLLEAILAHAGRNTGYTFHPEEIMADNFAEMMMGRADAPNPEVYDRLAAVLGIARPAHR